MMLWKDNKTYWRHYRLRIMQWKYILKRSNYVFFFQLKTAFINFIINLFHQKTKKQKKTRPKKQSQKKLFFASLFQSRGVLFLTLSVVWNSFNGFQKTFSVVCEGVKENLQIISAYVKIKAEKTVLLRYKNRKARSNIAFAV